MNYFEYLINNKLVNVLMVVISLDCIFGVLRAIKERKINSCVGIDGIIRKVRNANIRICNRNNRPDCKN